MSDQPKEPKIYLETYNMVQVVAYAVRNMKRDFKFLLGQPLLELNLQMILTISNANKTKEPNKKREILTHLSEQLNEFSLKVRLIRDLKLIDNSKHSKILQMLASVNSQRISWFNYLSKQANSKTL